MKKEISRSPKKGNPEEDDLWIDVHDDNVMREMGFFRPFDQTPRDPSVWTKTPQERKAIRKWKSIFKGRDMHFNMAPRKTIKNRGKLIINLYKNDKFGKTTISTTCWQHEISDVLANYRVTDRRTGIVASVVRSYKWNGREYDPRHLPV